MKANILRGILQNSAMTLHPEMMKLFKLGLVPLTWDQLERALQPLGGVCPSCKVQHVSHTQFVLVWNSSVIGEGTAVATNTLCVCVQCAEDKGYSIVTPDEMLVILGMGVHQSNVFNVVTRIKEMNRDAGGRCVGLPILSIGKRAPGSLDSCIVGYTACGNVLLEGNDTTAVFSRLGAQCGRCAAISSGRTLAKLGLRDRRYIGVDSKAKYGKLLGYQYVRRIIAERYRWLQGSQTDWLEWTTDPPTVVRTTPLAMAVPLTDLHSGLKNAPVRGTQVKPATEVDNVRTLLAGLEDVDQYQYDEHSESDDFSDE